MKCPKCGHVQTCPCKACQERNPTEKPWQWSGDDCSCGACGYTMNANDWLELEMKEYKRSQNERTN